MNNQNRDIRKNFITELYCGNIDPQSREFRKDSYLKKQMSIPTDTEKALTERLTEDDTIHPRPILSAFSAYLQNLNT